MKKLFLVCLMMLACTAWAFKDCPECPEMIEIPAGSFLMGSPPIFGGDDSEGPQHRVNINFFALGKYEVTQEQWHTVMGNNPSSNKGQTLPVENISWDDAQLFVQKLSQKTGKKYRLPSEAEWEFAARAGTTTQYFWGGDVKKAKNYGLFSANSGQGTQPVGLRKPNQFGLYDMVGNVWQWTQDCWNPNYDGAPTDGSAWKNGDCSRRVLRGGGNYPYPQFARSAYRVRDTATTRVSWYGLRVAMTP
jgi:formylglycine-generating enzyme required for sulfatase activity